MTSNIKNETTKYDNMFGLRFTAYSIWTFIIICRPQDILPILVKVRPALLTSIIAVVVYIICGNDKIHRVFFKQSQNKLYTMLVIVMILSIPFSLYSRLSFVSVFTQYIVVVLYFYLTFMLIDTLKKANRIILIGCIATGIYMFASVFMGSMNQNRLDFGSMFDPNDLAFFSLSFLTFNLIFISKENPLWIRIMCISFFIIDILAILLSGSRGGALGLGAITLMLILTKTKTIKFPIKVLFVVMCLFIVSFVRIDYTRYSAMINIKDDYNLNDETGRIAIWKIGIKAMFDNPITGVGVDCFPEVVGIDRARRGLDQARWQTAHNLCVQIGTETGVIGFCLFILLSVNAFRGFGRAKKEYYPLELIKIGEMAKIGFLGLFIAGMFLSQAYSFYWAFYIVLSSIIKQFVDDFDNNEK